MTNSFNCRTPRNDMADAVTSQYKYEDRKLEHNGKCVGFVAGRVFSVASAQRQQSQRWRRAAAVAASNDTATTAKEGLIHPADRKLSDKRRGSVSFSGSRIRRWVCWG